MDAGNATGPTNPPGRTSTPAGYAHAAVHLAAVSVCPRVACEGICKLCRHPNCLIGRLLDTWKRRESDQDIALRQRLTQPLHQAAGWVGVPAGQVGRAECCQARTSQCAGLHAAAAPGLEGGRPCWASANATGYSHMLSGEDLTMRQCLPQSLHQAWWVSVAAGVLLAPQVQAGQAGQLAQDCHVSMTAAQHAKDSMQSTAGPRWVRELKACSAKHTQHAQHNPGPGRSAAVEGLPRKHGWHASAGSLPA